MVASVSSMAVTVMVMVVWVMRSRCRHHYAWSREVVFVRNRLAPLMRPSEAVLVVRAHTVRGHFRVLVIQARRPPEVAALMVVVKIMRAFSRGRFC